MVIFTKKNYYRSKVVPLKQSTRNALVWRRQDFLMKILDLQVVLYWNFKTYYFNSLLCAGPRFLITTLR